MLKFDFKPFEELTTLELYEMLSLRQKVFVLEQNCSYLDADHKDLKSYHLLGWDNNGNLVAYARIVPPGLSYNEASIGRVLVAQTDRNKGYGIALMREAIHKCEALFGNNIRISAQSYLIQFYTDLGFAAVGESYLEDDIPHQEMFKFQ